MLGREAKLVGLLPFQVSIQVSTIFLRYLAVAGLLMIPPSIKRNAHSAFNRIDMVYSLL